MHRERQAVERVHCHPIAFVKGLVRPRTPELAADEHVPAGADHALEPDDLLRSDGDRRPPRRD
jgi:hypothetical protein